MDRHVHLLMKPPYIVAHLTDQVRATEVHAPPEPADMPNFQYAMPYEDIPVDQPQLRNAITYQAKRGGGEFLLFDFDEDAIVTVDDD